MDTLKMKFKLNGLEFELEGKEETVKNEFESFKEFVSTKLLNRLDIINSPQPSNNAIPPKPLGQLPGAIDIQPQTLNDIPVLKEVVKRDLPKTESDWILVYAYYASGYGEKTFTDKDIRGQYEATGRKNDSRMNNLTNNIKTLLNKEYFKLHNDTEYLIKQNGIDYCLQILAGNSSSKSVKRDKTKQPTEKTSLKDAKSSKEKKKTTSSVKFVDLALKTDQIQALNTFFIAKAPNTQNEEVLVVMKWYIDHTGKADISIEEINYLLSICSKVPSALEQVLINMKGAKYRWVANAENGRVKLSSIGDSFVLTKLPKSTK